MQSINPEPTKEELEQIRNIQARINSNKPHKDIVEEVRAKYTTPEYLKQQTMQMQE